MEGADKHVHSGEETQQPMNTPLRKADADKTGATALYLPAQNTLYRTHLTLTLHHSIRGARSMRERRACGVEDAGLGNGFGRRKGRRRLGWRWRSWVEMTY